MQELFETLTNCRPIIIKLFNRLRVLWLLRNYTDPERIQRGLVGRRQRLVHMNMRVTTAGHALCNALSIASTQTCTTHACTHTHTNTVRGKGTMPLDNQHSRSEEMPFKLQIAVDEEGRKLYINISSDTLRVKNKACSHVLLLLLFLPKQLRIARPGEDSGNTVDSNNPKNKCSCVVVDRSVEVQRDAGHVVLWW